MWSSDRRREASLMGCSSGEHSSACQPVRRYALARDNLWIISPISVLIGPDDLRPHDCLIDGELAVQFHNVLWFRGDVDHRVNALGLLPDFVRQPPAAPDVNIVHGAATLGD